MKITDVRIRKVEGAGRMKAVASVTFDNQFVVHEIRIIDGEKGLFIAMPSRKQADGTYIDVAHPINNNVRTILQNTILDVYSREDAAEEENA